MPAKLGAAPNLPKTSVTTKALGLASAEITATNTVKLKLIKMILYFGNFFHYSYFFGGFSSDLCQHWLSISKLFSVQLQC